MTKFATAFFNQLGIVGKKCESAVDELIRMIANDADLRTMCQVPINLALVCAVSVDAPELLVARDGRGVGPEHAARGEFLGRGVPQRNAPLAPRPPSLHCLRHVRRVSLMLSLPPSLSL